MLKPFILFTSLITATALSFYSQAQSNSIDTIRIGIAHGAYGNPPRTLFSPLSIAQKFNLIENDVASDNLKIEWIYFKGAGPAVNEALSNNQIDFALQGDLPSIVGRAAGLKTSLLVGLSTANTYIIVRPDSSIQTIEDLKNKKMAFHKGTNMHVGINKILESFGMKESDINFFNLDSSASIAAFYSNDIDGLAGSLNLLSLVKKGHARVIYSSQSDDSTTLKTNFLVRNAFKEEHPDITYKIVKSVVGAVAFVSDPDNEQTIYEDWNYMTITPEILHEDLAGVTLRQKFNPLYNEKTRQHLQHSIRIAKEAKLIRKPVEMESWIDDSFLNKAIEELNLINYWE